MRDIHPIVGPSANTVRKHGTHRHSTTLNQPAVPVDVSKFRYRTQHCYYHSTLLATLVTYGLLIHQVLIYLYLVVYIPGTSTYRSPAPLVPIDPDPMSTRSMY